jgi:hypothetical protein
VTFPLANPTNSNQEWKLIAATPPYLRFNATDGEPEIQPHNTFSFSVTSGRIPKRSEFDILAYFEPQAVGVYTQYWTLYQTSTNSTIQITVRGTGIPQHSSSQQVAPLMKAFKSNKKYPNSLFCKETTLLFPKTFLNCITTQKLCICNGTKSTMTVRVAVEPPFIARHKEFVLGPHSFKLLPCKYLPSKKGVIQSTLLLYTVDNNYKTSVQLVGEGE